MVPKSALCFYSQAWLSGGLVALAWALLNPAMAIALPPKDQIPEEVLRTEIITTARSPLSGAPLSASAYADLQEKLQQPPPPPPSRGKLAGLIMLLKVRRALQMILPL